MAGQSNLWSYNDLHERCFTEKEREKCAGGMKKEINQEEKEIK